jgi:hypothetical protein
MKTIEVRELGDTPLGIARVSHMAGAPDAGGQMTKHVFVLKVSTREAGRYESMEAAQAAVTGLIKAEKA